MAGETRRVALGEAADLITGFPFKSASYTEANDDIRLLRGDNIVQGTLRWEGVKRWPADEIDGYGAYLLHPGDVVLAMDRPWIEAGLKHATLTEQDCPCLLVQRVASAREVGPKSKIFGLRDPFRRVHKSYSWSANWNRRSAHQRESN